MSLAPKIYSKLKMESPFKYVLAHESGTVEAFFVSKTLADRCCNDLNATIGQGKSMWGVDKIFPDKDD